MLRLSIHRTTQFSKRHRYLRIIREIGSDQTRLINFDGILTNQLASLEKIRNEILPNEVDEACCFGRKKRIKVSNNEKISKYVKKSTCNVPI